MRTEVYIQEYLSLNYHNKKLKTNLILIIGDWSNTL